MAETTTANISEAYHKGLRYPEFSMVYMQILEIDNCDTDLFDSRYIIAGEQESTLDEKAIKKLKLRDSIDKQIFSLSEHQEAFVERFNPPDFYIEIYLDKDAKFPEPVVIKGTVSVDMSLFFNRTAVVTYSMRVDNSGDGFSCTAEGGNISTDQMISLAAIAIGGENWGDDELEGEEDIATEDENKENEENDDNIDLALPPIIIGSVKINSAGEWNDNSTNITYTNIKERENEEGVVFSDNPFETVMELYRIAITKYQETTYTKPDNFVYIDVWENINNDNYTLQNHVKEEDIISDIIRHHKKELIGLMSLYPREWPYRDSDAFDEICGANIAIDTDDLILLNSSMCVVFGTYGRRAQNSQTNWYKHLNKIRKSQNVSWPEHMLILEMVLAKRYTIEIVQDFILRSSRDISSARKSIERNASIDLQVTRLLLQLDAIKHSKFISHKVMFDRTIKRLEIDSREAKLKDVMNKVSESLATLSDTKSIKQGNVVNFILGVITVASLFEVILSDVKAPVVEEFFGKEHSHTFAAWLITVAVLAVALSVVGFLVMWVSPLISRYSQTWFAQIKKKIKLYRINR